MRSGHWVVLQLSTRASCAALPPPKSPPLRRGALGRWHRALLATNDVSMDALFAREVQFFVRRSKSVLAHLNGAAPADGQLSVRRASRVSAKSRIMSPNSTLSQAVSEPIE